MAFILVLLASLSSYAEVTYKYSQDFHYKFIVKKEVFKHEDLKKIRILLNAEFKSAGTVNNLSEPALQLLVDTTYLASVNKISNSKSVLDHLWQQLGKLSETKNFIPFPLTVLEKLENDLSFSSYVHLLVLLLDYYPIQGPGQSFQGLIENTCYFFTFLKREDYMQKCIDAYMRTFTKKQAERARATKTMQWINFYSQNYNKWDKVYKYIDEGLKIFKNEPDMMRLLLTRRILLKTREWKLASARSDYAQLEKMSDNKEPLIYLNFMLLYAEGHRVKAQEEFGRVVVPTGTEYLLNYYREAMLIYFDFDLKKVKAYNDKLLQLSNNLIHKLPAYFMDIILKSLLKEELDPALAREFFSETARQFKLAGLNDRRNELLLEIGMSFFSKVNDEPDINAIKSKFIELKKHISPKSILEVALDRYIAAIASENSKKSSTISK